MLQCSMETPAAIGRLGGEVKSKEISHASRCIYRKQERKADHIEQGYEKRGVSKKEAESRAWATVNKQDKGGKNDGSGRSRSRSAAAKKGWETRRRRSK